MTFLDPKTGWKTYAVVVVGLGLGVAQAAGIHIPTWIDWSLTFLGLGALRNGVKNQTASLAATIIEAITYTDANGVAAPVTPVETSALPPLHPGKSPGSWQ